MLLVGEMASSSSSFTEALRVGQTCEALFGDKWYKSWYEGPCDGGGFLVSERKRGAKKFKSGTVTWSVDREEIREDKAEAIKREQEQARTQDDAEEEPARRPSSSRGNKSSKHNALAVPAGWTKSLELTGKSGRCDYYYRHPDCSRRLRSLPEVHRWIKASGKGGDKRESKPPLCVYLCIRRLLLEVLVALL